MENNAKRATLIARFPPRPSAAPPLLFAKAPGGSAKPHPRASVARKLDFPPL